MFSQTFLIPHASVGLLYEDGAFIRPLPPGRHVFRRAPWSSLQRRCVLVDMRERSAVIKGQEIQTADKVAIRVSLLVYFRVRDPAAAMHHVASYEERIYEDVQLAARRYLASKNLDAILNDRNEISDAVRNDVRESAAGFGVEIVRADVKDLVFPGNLREIMNQVLETERRAEAKLIEARKEAEAQKIKAQVQAEAEIARLEREKEQIRIKAESEREAMRLRIESEVAQAKAIAEHPVLLRLRRLEALRELARSERGRFVFGFRANELDDADDP